MKLKLILSSLFALVACAPEVDNRGFDDIEKLSKQICVGKDTKETVKHKISAPNTTSFGGQEEVWYYVFKKQETTAFFAPRTTIEQLLRLEFDARGVVKSVSLAHGNKAHAVAIVREKTPTHGKRENYMQQIFVENLGRFSDTSRPED